MVPESRLEPTEQGLVPKGDGWFVLNAREARWLHAPGRSAICIFEGFLEDEQDFLQVGITVDEVARRHGVSVEQDTTDAKQAYAGLPRRDPTRYREGWLPPLAA